MNQVSGEIPTQSTDSLALYRRLFAYVLPYKAAFVVALAGMLLVAIGDTTTAWILQPIMNQGFIDRDLDFIAWVPVLLIAIAFARALGNFIDSYCITWISRRVIQDLRQKMFERLLYAPTEFFDHHSSGGLVSRLTYDVEQVAQASSSAFRILFRDIIKAVFLLSLMIYLSWKLSLIFVLILPVAFLVFKFTSHRFRAISAKIQDSVGEIIHIARQTFSGHQLVKVFSGYDQESEVFFKANNHHRQQYMKKAAIQAASVPVLVFTMGLGVACVIWLALILEINAGAFTSYLVSMTMIVRPVQNLSKVNEVIQTGMAGAESVFRTIDQAMEADTGSVVLGGGGKVRGDISGAVRGDVRFNEVSFTYLSDMSATVLHAINFTIPAGSTVALVGSSGSGKSTIASILMRFYAPTSGEVSIDGQPLQDITLQSLRRHLSVVSQEVILFDDTIRNNVIYGSTKNVDEARLQFALKAAKLSAFIDTLSDGLDTMVGEAGVRLSGGQRQRIAIARALYKDAPILILDEATSSLDARSEQFIQQAIDNLILDRTTLIIAHRLSTIENADKVFVLDHGKIVEGGTHHELMSKKGFYFNLYKNQFRPEPQHDEPQHDEPHEQQQPEKPSVR